jgi:hypothetical protein
MTHDVFISYATEDRAAADAIRATLAASGVRPWMAREATGLGTAAGNPNPWAQSEAFILILSSSANKSEEVQREVQIAFRVGVPMVFFCVDKAQPTPELQHLIEADAVFRPVCSGERVLWLESSSPPPQADLKNLRQAVKGIFQASAEFPEFKPLSDRRAPEPVRPMRTTPERPAFARMLARIYSTGWHFPSFLAGVGKALMLFPPPPRRSERSDVDAISADLEKVLYDFAAVLHRHGHNLDTSGEKPDVA